MTTPEKPSTPDEPAWKTCEVCGGLPDDDWYDAFSSGDFEAGFSSLERLGTDDFDQSGGEIEII